jgi:hypothetical protein
MVELTSGQFGVLMVLLGYLIGGASVALIFGYLRWLRTP